MEFMMFVAIYCFNLTEATWKFWARFGFTFVTVCEPGKAPRIAHAKMIGSRTFVKYVGMHGQIELRANGQTSDVGCTWEALSESPAVLVLQS